jgi:hypothetical protein
MSIKPMSIGHSIESNLRYDGHAHNFTLVKLKGNKMANMVCEYSRCKKTC